MSDTNGDKVQPTERDTKVERETTETHERPAPQPEKNGEDDED